jgi:hypothetical protein
MRGIVAASVAGHQDWEENLMTLVLTGHIDEHHRLCVDLPDNVRPGPVKIRLELKQIEEEDDWGAAVAQAWAADWSDPHEDIYTLEDGEPSDGTR